MNKISKHLSRDPKMAELVKKFPNVEKDWLKLKKEKRDVFVSITRTIVGQQLSVKAARTIWGRFEKLVGKITPENILKKTDADLREVGMSWAKARYVLALAEAVNSKKFDPENLYKLSDEDARSTLIELKGIGHWSADMILMFTLHKPDIFSVGDMGLKNAVSKVYGVDKADLEKIVKISENWSPYRTIACLYLWESLDNTPKN